MSGAHVLRTVSRKTVPNENLSIVVNTGDDFEHWGLWISPDLDTVMYVLAEIEHPKQGWGLRDESFISFERMREMGEASWFALGDKDLATHMMRTKWRDAGLTLTEITKKLYQRLTIPPVTLPMSDDPLHTMIHCRDGRVLPFQEWLVKERAIPKVSLVEYQGTTKASPAVLSTLAQADLVCIAPSNPYVSIDPILSLDGVRELVKSKPCVAISPILNGKPVKGPLGCMIDSIEGKAASAQAILEHYGDLLNAFVVEDGEEIDASIPIFHTQTLMHSAKDRIRLAKDVLDFAARSIDPR